MLMRFNELREALRLRLAGEDARFKDEELKAVVALLAGPGVVWELKFGSWVLLQPERINAYAQAVIQTLRADEHERGCLPEERVLKGDLTYHSSMQRLDPDEERFVLLAMHQTLVERGLCLREQTDKGPMLIFPSYYRRERPELVGHPAVLVSYRFTGFLDDIYATLVVRLHHTKAFQQDQLWRYAADFKTVTGKQLGVKLTRRAEGVGRVGGVFRPGHRGGGEDHLQPVRPRAPAAEGAGRGAAAALRVPALRHTGGQSRSGDATAGGVAGREEGRIRAIRNCRPFSACTARSAYRCGTTWSSASPATRRSSACANCRSNRRVVLDNESKERALVGEVISTVALAGQISREFNVSDHGIDMEIEFKDDAGEATGQKLYLQLKSGDSR